MKKIITLLLTTVVLFSLSGTDFAAIGTWRIKHSDLPGVFSLTDSSGRAVEVRFALALPPWNYCASSSLRNASVKKTDAQTITVQGDIATPKGDCHLNFSLSVQEEGLQINWQADMTNEVKFVMKPAMQFILKGFDSKDSFYVVNSVLPDTTSNVWKWGKSWECAAAGIGMLTQKDCSINYLKNKDSRELRLIPIHKDKQSQMSCKLILGKVQTTYKELRIEGKCTRARALFAPGEKMTFTFQAFEKKSPFNGQKIFWQWKRFGDDLKVAQGKEPYIAGKPLHVTTSLDRPGFIWLQIRLVTGSGIVLNNGSGEIVYNAGAGVNITELKGAEPPEELVQFRQKMMGRLKAVPVKSEIVPAGVVNGVKIFKVKVSAPGNRSVTGYLSIPQSGGPFPAQVNFFGYSTSSIQRSPAKPPVNRIDFWINAHGYELEQPESYYKDFYKKICTDPRGYAWNEKENISPDTTYFNGMALRAARAAQFLTTLPEWNKKELCAAGGSQGGLQALWCAWLAPEAVTRVAVEKPWCCFLEGPRRGFYSAGLTLKPLPGVLYFDPTNFVSQISCPINIYYAGLGDYMCPPSGLAVLFNRLNKGQITFYQGGTHGGAPRNSQNFTLKK